MDRKKGKTKAEQAVTDYRHEEAKRLHIPPAGLAAYTPYVSPQLI